MKQTEFDSKNIEKLIPLLIAGNNVFIWKIQGNNTKVQSDWSYCLENNVLAFNVPLSDMTGKTQATLISEYIELDGKDPEKSNASFIATQSLSFRDNLDADSIVISCQKDGDNLIILGWGECTDAAYHYNDMQEYKHYKSVVWHRLPLIEVSDSTKKKSSFAFLSYSTCHDLLQKIISLDKNH